jgi:hypothetical protein
MVSDKKIFVGISHRVLYEIKFGCGGHLGLCSEMSDTILEEDHPRIINGQNCSILSQKVPKFELYKHNDELLNRYYGIFYELLTFAYFDPLCK